MRSPPGGFLGGANVFRSLTLSPMNTALQQAHQMAPRHLEAGGAAAATPKRATPDLAPRDYVLPLDVDPDQVRRAIVAKLWERGLPRPADALPVIERRAGGRVAVPARHLLQLGDGRFDRGRQFMHGLVKQIRARRVRRTAPITDARAGIARS